MQTIHPEPLTRAAFAPFGDVLETREAADFLINEGRCGRHHDLARLDFRDGRAGISLFDAEGIALPHRLDLMERHPMGSQAFLPVGDARCLVTVAEEVGGEPGRPRAFLTAPGQGWNVARGVWHGVLAPLGGRGRFFVVDRIGKGDNLVERRFEATWHVLADPDGETGA